MSAQVFAGVAEGAAESIDYLNNTEIREATRKAALVKQQLAEEKLADYQAQAPVRRAEEEAQLRNINGALLKDTTVRGLRMFEADNNARHLNTWLQDAKRNPIGSNLFGHIARYDNLSMKDKDLMSKYGYDLNSGFDTLSNNVVIATMADGSQAPISKEKLYAATGFTNYLDDQELRKLELESEKSDGLTRTAAERGIAQILKDNEGMTYQRAASIYYDTVNSGKRMSDAQAFVKAREAEATAVGRSFTESDRVAAFDEFKNIKDTSTQKEIGNVQQLRQGLKEVGWRDKKISEFTPEQLDNIYTEFISPIEDLRGVKFTSEEKREIRNLRKLMSLGKTASEKLTDEETGLIDRPLNNIKKYISDNVKGKEAVSAYETFRNVFRNALYGSALTANEIEAFNAASGNLAQQLGPVLEQLKVQLRSVQEEFQAIMDLNDPDVSKYYLGASTEEMDDVMYALQERIDLIEGKINSSGNIPENVQKWSDKLNNPVQQTIQNIPAETPNNQPAPFDIDAALDARGL